MTDDIAVNCIYVLDSVDLVKLSLLEIVIVAERAWLWRFSESCMISYEMVVNWLV